MTDNADPDLSGNKLSASLQALIDDFNNHRIFTPPKPSKDGLSSLPAELRNRIYSLVLPTKIIYNFSARGQYPPISQTNRFLRHETLPIWRANNEWRYYTRTQDFKKLPLDDLALHINAGLRDIKNFRWEEDWELPGSLKLRLPTYNIKVTIFNDECYIDLDSQHIDREQHVEWDWYWAQEVRTVAVTDETVHWEAVWRAKDMMKTLEDVLERRLELKLTKTKFWRTVAPV